MEAILWIEEKSSQNLTADSGANVKVKQTGEILEALGQTWVVEHQAEIRPQSEASDGLSTVPSWLALAVAWGAPK